MTSKFDILVTLRSTTSDVVITGYFYPEPIDFPKEKVEADLEMIQKKFGMGRVDYLCLYTRDDALMFGPHRPKERITEKEIMIPSRVLETSVMVSQLIELKEAK